MIPQQNGLVAIGTFKGLLSQTGTGNPTFIELINTLGITSFTRIAAGIYAPNYPTGVSPTTRRIIFNGNTTDATEGGTVRQQLSIVAIDDYSWTTEAGLIKLKRNSDLALVDLSTLAGGTVKLYIQIEVYNQIEVPQT